MAVEWALFSKCRKSMTDKWGQLKLGHLARLPCPFLQPAFVAQLYDGQLINIASKIYHYWYH